METNVGLLDHRHTWYMRQRSRVSGEVVEKLLLAEENRAIIRMGCTTELDAEEASVDLVADVLRC